MTYIETDWTRAWDILRSVQHAAQHMSAAWIALEHAKVHVAFDAAAHGDLSFGE